MATQVLNHANIYIYPNPIPIDGYVGRACAQRAAAGRKSGNGYGRQAVIERTGPRKLESIRTSEVQPSRVQQVTSTAVMKADADKKGHGSEGVRYIRLMVIVETVTALCLGGVWQLWHVIH